MKHLTTKQIAMLAFMIAVVTAFTRVVQIPFPSTAGYLHLGDVAIFFASFAFGPWVGAIAGGVGTALADLSSGYGNYAPISLLAHGLEGLIAGYLGAGLVSKRRQWLGWLAGTLVMIAIYFVGEAFVLQTGVLPAAMETVGNLAQGAAGILGMSLYYAVLRAYPPIYQFGLGQPPREK